MNPSAKQRAYNLGLMQGRAYRTLSSHLTKALFPYDLSIPEWKLLGQLFDHGNMKLAQLAALLSVEAPLVTALVDKLEKKQLVERTNDAKDRRAKVIVTTKKGSKLVEEIEPNVRATMRSLFKGITPEEIKTYLKVLNAIDTNGSA
jgi:DNA-binding MarR family transcriptional regulator